MTSSADTSEADDRVVRMPLTRQAVISAARDMIVEVGHEALSLRPLAARLGVTAAAMYAHVENKHELLRAIAAERYNALAELYEAIETDDPAEKIREIARLYLEDAHSNPELFRVKFMFPPMLGDNDGKEGTVVGQRAFDIAVTAIEQAMDEGRLKKDDPIDVSFALWASVHGVAVFDLASGNMDKAHRTRILEIVMDNLISGMGEKS